MNAAVFGPGDVAGAIRAFESLELLDRPRPAFIEKFARAKHLHLAGMTGNTEDAGTLAYLRCRRFQLLRPLPDLAPIADQDRVRPGIEERPQDVAAVFLLSGRRSTWPCSKWRRTGAHSMPGRRPWSGR